MACIVYREGKGTIEHGIECESTTCESWEVADLLSSGWSATPPGYEHPEIPESPDEEDNTDNVDDETDNLKEQIRILTELDEASKAEIQRLTEEVDRLNGVVAELSPDDDDATNPEAIRQAAKEKGIEGWDTKRITTLKKMLEE